MLDEILSTLANRDKEFYRLVEMCAENDDRELIIQCLAVNAQDKKFSELISHYLVVANKVIELLEVACDGQGEHEPA